MVFRSSPSPRGRGGTFGGGWKVQIGQGVLVGYLLCGSYNWTFEKAWYYWLAGGCVSCKANARDPWDVGAKCKCVLQRECEAREWLLGRSTREGGKDAAILFSSDELGAWRGQGGQVGGLEMPSIGQCSKLQNILIFIVGNGIVEQVQNMNKMDVQVRRWQNGKIQAQRK